MPDIIQLLPDAIANQIAAGEVVQRPASVVKELLENSIDAGSSFIKLVVKDSGKQLIQVVDDGKGMSETDARMSFERHATSKIKKSEDLFSLHTMGFRGEALASIAAVAQVEMKSKQPDAELGTLMQVEASEIKKQEHAACTDGTSIAVKNLFYNVPARRNFLKSNPVELKHIIEEFQRVALANPQVGFSFHQNDLDVYHLPAGKLSQRIVGIFGKSYREQLVSCSEETDQLTVHGYIGKPEFAKKTRGEQFFFVNNRFIKSGYLNHAVTNAFENLLPSDTFPFYVLFIQIDPKHIDVNVHPTKTEINFDDERTVYGIVSAAVKQALGTHNIAPSLDFDRDVNFNFTNPRPVQTSGGGGSKHNYGSFKPKGDESDEWNKVLANFQELSKRISEEETSQPNREEAESSGAITFDSAINQMPGSQEQSADELEPAQDTFQIHNRYIATQVKSGLMLIDQNAAHERILYEKFQEHLENKSGTSQQFLFPQQVKLSTTDYAIVMEMEEELKALGFGISPFGKETVVINGAPSELAETSVKSVFEGLLEQFKQNKSELSLSRTENMARSVAKRSAIKHGKKLNPQEMNALIDKLFACSNPNYAPNGKLTFVIFDLEKMAGFFNR